jgi:hypothetical protein
MSKAFIFLNCDVGTAQSVMTQMKSILGVSQTNGLSGIYDIVAEVDAESAKGISGIVKRFRSIDSVRSCLTMMVADHQAASTKRMLA